MKILLVEADELLSASLTKLLEANHYTVDLASDGQAGLNSATAVDYDLILLDVQVPKLDGIHLCRQLRFQNYGKPILLLTANDSDADAIAGFDAGADDYISKLCASEVLLARIRTLLRRSGASILQNAAKDTNTTLTWGDLCLSLDSGRVTFREQVITLTATEYNLLELFLRNPDRIFSRSAILDRLWGLDNAPTDRAIVTHVKDVRKKLKAGGLTEDLIETVYGMGYRLKPAPQSSYSGTASPSKQRTQPPQIQSQKPQSATNQVLQRSQTFDQQVAVLRQAAARSGEMPTELQQAAKQEAHKLAGSLASFGYPEGSRVARSIEHLLIGNDSLSPEEATEFVELVTALQQALAKSPTPKSTALGTSSASLAAASNHQVLVIDDDAILTEQLAAEAQTWGFHLKIASNPEIARSYLKSSTFDAILLDLSFADTEEDGLSLLQEIAEQFSAETVVPPTVVFTGRDSLTDRLAVSRLGARQFLHKPATSEQIFQAITRLLSKPQALEAKLLIVDDDPAMLSLLSTLLSPWGLEVVTLNEPQHFWQVLVATSPNLILLDLEMPQVSGLELCQVVRQDGQWGDLPILVVTAHTNADSLQKAFAAGADDFITKPVLGPELVTRVLSRIERSRLQQRSVGFGSVTQRGHSK